VFVSADNCLHIYRVCIVCSLYIILLRIGGCVCDIKIRYCIYLNKSKFCASRRMMAANSVVKHKRGKSIKSGEKKMYAEERLERHVPSHSGMFIAFIFLTYFSLITIHFNVLGRQHFSNRRSTRLRAAYVCRTDSNISITCFKGVGGRREFVLTVSQLNRDEV
jgi:hypothetical protein